MNRWIEMEWRKRGEDREGGRKREKERKERKKGEKERKANQDKRLCGLNRE